MTSIRTWWPVLLLVAGQALAMESGTFLDKNVLRDKPKANAKILADVARGTKAQIVAQDGKWFRVVIDGKWTGWVPVAALRRHDATVGGGVNSLDSMSGTSAFGGASSTGGAPSTAGKR